MKTLIMVRMYSINSAIVTFYSQSQIIQNSVTASLVIMPVFILHVLQN